MPGADKDLSRRGFLVRSATTGASVLLGAGAASFVGCRKDEQPPAGTPPPSSAAPQPAPPPPTQGASTLARVPTRPFGASGISVPALSLAAAYHRVEVRPLLEAALRLGVTYWDTSEEFADGNEERGLGAFLRDHPGAREQVFIETKSVARDPDGLSRSLDGSLERLGTDRVDLYMMQAIEDPSVLTPALRAWADKARADGRIRLFGFSTHKNAVPCLEAAAGLGWIDGIMLPYNFRLMRDEATVAAVKACREAGVGLTAIKFRALEADLDQGASANRVEDPVKLRALLQSRDIASVCAYAPDTATLEAYASAAASPTPPSAEEMTRLAAYAEETGAGYCAGCGYLCEPAAQGAPIADVTRFLMYHRSYDDPSRARSGFACIPSDTRACLPDIDYREAERRCPNRLPIARLMRDATRLLA